MAIWRGITLVAVGGLIESFHPEAGLWIVLLVAGAIGWSWSVVFAAALGVRDRIQVAFGLRRPQPRTDAAALAEELSALRAQVAQMRETATNFDLSFDQALERLDRRVDRVERQSSHSERVEETVEYVQIRSS